VTERPALFRKAERFLVSAQLLTDSGDLDSAVSRAPTMRPSTLPKPCSTALGRSFSSHKGVISAYGQEFAQNARLDPRFHRLLITSFEKRQQADYLVDTGLEPDEVSELLAETHAFVQAAKSWLVQERLFDQ